MITQRIPKGFQDAINIIDEMVKKTVAKTSSVSVFAADNVI